MASHGFAHENFDLVTLHDEASTLSFREKFKIMQSIRPHLGHLRLGHISLDLCSPDDVMLFLSSNPTTGYNICSTPLWKMDGSISPTYFKNNCFYWWDDAYIADAADAIMVRKESAHGLSRGFMLCKKVNEFYFVYSFGLEQNHDDNERFVQEHRDAYMLIGDKVYADLRDVYQKYCPNFEVPVIEVEPGLKVIINNE
jgi:hypothetical protein